MTIQPGPLQPYKETNPYDNLSTAVRQTLNSNVGKVNPALYAAGARMNLTREERNLIETWSSIKGTHEKLMNMNNKKAAESFKKLNPEDQQTLTSYYKVDYANKTNKNLIIENPSIRKLLSLDDGFSPGDFIKSPFRLFMGAAGIYERTYNAPFTQALATVTNRENFWSRSNFEMSFDGEFSYDEKLKQQLINKYGEELSFAAMHLLAGKTPGEIIDAYGPNSAGILQAVNQVFNEPDKIAGIMDEFDRARLSPGRGVARWINKTFGIDAEKNQTMFKVGSGAIDLAFQIFADPLTYLTGGRSTFLKAERLTKALITSRDTVAYFADPAVAKYFEGYATKLGEYSAARKAGNSNEAAKILENIQSKYQRHGTDEEIELWISAPYNVTDFDSFKNLFLAEGAQEFDKLIQGKVVGTAFSSTSAVYAKRSREFTFKAKEKVKEVFRGKAAFDQLDEAGTAKLLDELSKVNEVNYSDIEKTIQEVNGKGVKKLLRQLEYQFSLHPGMGAVFANERYIETIETVRRQANLVFKNKALAHLFTEHFKSATITERKFLKKNLDTLTLRSTGMYGMPGGEQYAENILDDKYGVGKLFGVQSEITMPPQLGSGLVDNTIRGPLGSSGFKEAYSSLPFQEISQFIAFNQLRAEKKLNARTVANIFGGAYNSKVVSDFIDFWSQFTLFPQLGVRSSIDEGFMLAITQNRTFVKEFFKAQKYGKIFPVIGGSNKSVGPIKDTIDFVLGKLTGKNIGPTRTISPKQRDDINAQIDEEFVQGLYTTKKEADTARILRFADIGIAKYGKNIAEKNKEYLTSLARYSPQYLDDVRALKVFNATLNKEYIRTPESIITKENFDKSLELAGLEKTGIHKIQSLKNFSDERAEATIFHNFGTTFNQGPYDLGPLNKRQNLDAARLFIANNALETAEDADRAVAQFLKAVGFIQTSKNVWVPSIQDATNIKRFIESGSHFLKFDGLSDAKKVEGFIRDVFADFYVAFHGGPLQYNDELVKIFKPFIDGRVPDHRLILKKIDRTEDVLKDGKVIIPSFSKMIKNYKPVDVVSDLDVQAGYAKNVRKFGNRLYEGMARTNDDLIRTPAVQAHYVLSRGQSEPEEIAMAAKIAEKLIEDGMEPYLAFNHASFVADEFFTSRAVSEATNRVLKYVDNPDIRTVFAYNIKTLGRFYRAVEDFQRRVYRLVEGNKLNTIYRLRLMGQGLDSFGEVHEDTNGEKYLILPMDDIIYSAVDGTLRMLTDDQVTFKQPLFNDITFNVTAGNPSFQTDAGMPYLSGPAASLSIMAVRSLLGKFDTTAQVAEDLDEWTLGSMGDNVNFRSAVTPKFLNNVWNMLSPDERNQQEVSAYVQALSYNQANDLGIDPTDYYNSETGETDQARLDEDKRKYLDTVKISAHNIIVTRSLLGMILPFAVQTKDTKDLPTYLKDVGVVSMKTSFYEVFDQIKLKYPDVENPYELALATWMGENPGKVAYVVNTNQETVKPLIKYSEEMQNWVIANRKEIEKYGNGAMMFAPNTGKFSPGVYKWAEATGLTSRIPANETARGYIEKFYEDLMFKEHVNAYYDINDREEIDLLNVPFESADLRRASLNAYTKLRKQYRIGVPGIEDYIDSGRDITDSTDFIQSAYNYVNAPEADVRPEVKQKINEAYEIFNKFISDVNYIESLDPEGAADMKRAIKTEAQEKIKKLIASDTSKTVEQYYNYGLLKVMNAKSRDARPGISRNVVKKIGN